MARKLVAFASAFGVGGDARGVRGGRAVHDRSLESDEAPFRRWVYGCLMGQVFLLSLTAALNPVLVGPRR